MSANRPCSMRSPQPLRQKRRITRSAPSNRMSGGSPCRTSGSRFLHASQNRQKSSRPSLNLSTLPDWFAAPPAARDSATSFSDTFEVDAIAHVLRCFSDGNVVHVEGSVDPIRDAETVETELMLADLEGLERRTLQMVKRARGGDREARAQLEIAETVLAALREGRPARGVHVGPERQRDLNALQL